MVKVLPYIIHHVKVRLTIEHVSVGMNGVMGVVTYDVEGTGLKVAGMFYIPLNQGISRNSYNFKVSTYKPSVLLLRSSIFAGYLLVIYQSL